MPRDDDDTWYEDDSYRHESTTTREIPYDKTVEESLLGACMLSAKAREVALGRVTGADFYVPAYSHVWDAIERLHSEGQAIDPVTLADDLRSRGLLELVGGASILLSIQGWTPATSSAGRYADIVAMHSVRRRIIAAAGAAMDAAYSLDTDPGVVVDDARDQMAAALSGITVAEPSDLHIMDEFLDRPQEERPQWIIPGIMRQGWRCMLVAPEGVGKTVLFRQIALAAAQGIHPLHFAPMPPVRALIVDLENPEDSIHDVCSPIRAQAERVSTTYDSDRAWLWHKPGGINLLDRRDRADLEAVIAKTRPELVALGPIYKAFSLSGNDNEESAVKQLMQVFDDLRTRYGFALFLEHHAAKGSGKARDMLPYGSSLWLRWPELGLGLVPTEPTNQTLRVGRWRGDRMENAWPIEISRSQPWPWAGKWPDGTFTPPGERPVPTTGGIALPSDAVRQPAPKLPNLPSWDDEESPWAPGWERTAPGDEERPF